MSAEPQHGLGLLLAGDVDLAVVDEYDYVPLALPEAAVVRELDTEALVVVRAPHATPRRVSLADLADADWVMPPEDAACGRAVRAACRTVGFEPRVRWETDDMLLLTRAVADGHGVAVLPRRSVALEPASGFADPPVQVTPLRVTGVDPAAARGGPRAAASPGPSSGPCWTRSATPSPGRARSECTGPRPPGPRCALDVSALPDIRRVFAEPTGVSRSDLAATPLDVRERHACNLRSVLFRSPPDSSPRRSS